MKNPERTRGYKHRLMAVATNFKLPQGEVSTVTVKHDEWCKSNHSKPCNCFPIITLRTSVATYIVDESGKVSSAN